MSRGGRPPPGPVAHRGPAHERPPTSIQTESLNVPPRSPEERRLLAAADRVYELVDAIERDPTEERVRALAAAFETLQQSADAARAARRDARYVDDVVGMARLACVRVAQDVVTPLVDPRELGIDPEDV